MEKEQITTEIDKRKEKDEYCEILRKASNRNVSRTYEDGIYVGNSNHGHGSSIPNKIDLLSLRLYNKNLTETEIENLVNQGANVNHKDSVFLECCGSIAMYHAGNDTEQGVKNMAQLIKHGIHLHNTYLRRIPLHVAAERNNTGMIKLLLPVTLSPDEENDEEDEDIARVQEELKNTVINRAFREHNDEVIESLLKLNIFTSEEVLEKFINNAMPNEKIANLLHQYKATCNGHMRYQIYALTSMWIKHITCLSQIFTIESSYHPDILEEFYALQKVVSNSIEPLEQHKANQEK
jgi:hypothetical protein